MFLSRDTSTLVRAFTTCVRPLLKYCSCIWSPHFKNGIYKVEYVQRNFTKKLRGMSDLYSDRLAAINLSSLELRRLRNNLIWCYKILFGVVEMPDSLPRDTNFNSVAGFKRSIAKVDLTVFLKGDFMLS